MLFLTDGVKLQARNCEDSHECRLLNKKTEQKSDDRERSYDVIYTPTQKRDTRPFWDVTAFMGFNAGKGDLS